MWIVWHQALAVQRLPVDSQQKEPAEEDGEGEGCQVEQPAYEDGC
jgi:hypothetical protein